MVLLRIILGRRGKGLWGSIGRGSGVMGGSVGFFFFLKIDSFMGLVEVGDGGGSRESRRLVATPNFEVGDLRFRGIEFSRKGSVVENTVMTENSGFG